MDNTYTLQQEQIIRDNYSDFGPKYCGKLIGKHPEAVGAKARRMGIQKVGHRKHPTMQKINPEQFWSITKPEIAYFLGYFWADGNIIYQKIRTSNSYAICMEIASEDANDIMPIMNNIGQWAINSRKRQKNWKETTTFSTNSKDIFEFMFAHDYKTKSFSEPTKILEKIPESLKPYWWRGYFDGDGSLYISEKGRSKCLQFSSTFNYKWIETIKLFKELLIDNQSIFEAESKLGHKSSKISLFSKDSIHKLISYLRKSNLGLKRKTLKMEEFYKRFPFIYSLE